MAIYRVNMYYRFIYSGLRLTVTVGYLPLEPRGVLMVCTKSYTANVHLIIGPPSFLQPHLKYYGRFCRCYYVGLHTLVVLHDYIMDMSNVDLCTALQSDIDTQYTRATLSFIYSSSKI